MVKGDDNVKVRPSMWALLTRQPDRQAIADGVQLIRDQEFEALRSHTLHHAPALAMTGLVDDIKSWCAEGGFGEAKAIMTWTILLERYKAADLRRHLLKPWSARVALLGIIIGLVGWIWSIVIAVM